jgi:hypothetical protein
MKKIALALAFLLAACNSNQSIPTPSVGQWVQFGSNNLVINQGPPMSFAFGGAALAAGYFYTALPSAPRVGQTLTLNYSVRGVNPEWQQVPASGGNAQTDINPPTLHLFLWRKGDDISCNSTNQKEDPITKQVTANNGGFADYRLFADLTPLVLGENQTLSVPLDPEHWTGCWGFPPLNMQDELNNLLGVGMVFGGQWFAGHGVYISGGSATFIVNSITIQ